MIERRPSRRVRVSAWIRAFAAFVALLVAGDHSLASLHQTHTAHQVCAEHGELIHADSAGHVASHGSEGSDPAVDADELSAEHHHCRVVPAAPARAPAASAPAECAAAALASVEAIESFESDLGIFDVLAFAPKQSPPV